MTGGVARALAVCTWWCVVWLFAFLLEQPCGHRAQGAPLSSSSGGLLLLSGLLWGNGNLKAKPEDMSPWRAMELPEFHASFISAGVSCEHLTSAHPSVIKSRVSVGDSGSIYENKMTFSWSSHSCHPCETEGGREGPGVGGLRTDCPIVLSPSPTRPSPSALRQKRPCWGPVVAESLRKHWSVVTQSRPSWK